jgi:hypothetical protein
MKKVIITMPEVPDERWKAWAKILEDVDKSKSSGYAFIGKFISLSRKRNEVKYELEVGTIIMVYAEVGSRKYHKPTITLYEVLENGELEEIYYCECSGYSWALEVRDDIYEILKKKKAEAVLKEIEKIQETGG